MENRRDRAFRDARSWATSRRELLALLIPGGLGLLAVWQWGSRSGAVDTLIVLCAAVGGAILTPAVVFLGSLATANGRILREEIAALKAATPGSPRAQPPKRPDPLIDGLRLLVAKHATLSDRAPRTYNDSTPADLGQEIDKLVEETAEFLRAHGVDRFFIEQYRSDPTSYDDRKPYVRHEIEHRSTMLNRAIQHLKDKE